MATTAPQTRHAVTALIVAHDGARLLPGLVKALQAQTYRVEQVVGADTGSRDRSGAVLAELIGQDAVFGMDRSTGYGEAVAVALRHATRRHSDRTDPNLRRVEWIWLLHDDCRAPEALERLLRAATKDRSVVVLGPKVLDGQDRRTLREVGVSIDRAGRRVTGIDPGEIDQGQRDFNKAVLAVGSAGMLIRRDVWDQLGGFDIRLRLFRDDLDFCWRVQAAGYRVQVVTDAVLYHRELSARRRRPTEGGSPRRLDRRNALYVLAVNLPLLTMLRVVGGCVAGSLSRAAYFLVTKQLDLAGAHAYAVVWLFLHPIRLWQGRRRRSAGRAAAYNAVRLFIPPARTLSRLAERLAGLLSNGPPQASSGRHQASAEESEEDEQFVDAPSVFRRIISNPCVQLVTALLLIALIAERRLLGSSPLGGGALVPAWGGSAALWREYLAGFHTVGVGSTASAPPYLVVVAALGTVLGGQAWLAVDVLLLGCVPLAGLTAYLATRRLVTATTARVLLAASYALLPVATGSVAAGRLGTAVAFILLPLIGINAGRMLTAAPRQARRAAWAVGLLVAVAAAFAPLAWVLAVVFAVGALAARRWLLAADPVNAAIVAVVPFFMLFPWSLHLLTDPSAFITEAGVQTPGLTTAGLGPSALLALSPGGPGVPPVWVTVGFGLALLAAVLPLRRAGVAIAGWCVAIAGLLAAVVVSRISVTPAGGGQSAAGWPGVALALAALGLLLAAAPAAEWLEEMIRNGRVASSDRPDPSRVGRGRSRRALAAIALVAAGTAPLLVAGYWVKEGVRGPVGSVTAPLLPAFVSASSTSGEQYRTLILRPDVSGGNEGSANDSTANDSGLDYMVVRQGDPTLGEPELAIATAAEQTLSRQVAALGAPDGADAGDPGLVLGSFGIRWVLLPGPVDAALAQRLDAAVGLVALSKASAYDLWQVSGPVARVRVIAPDGTTTPLTAGPVGMSAVGAPASGGTLVLAEPYGGWTATLNGRALKPVAAPVDGWAQGFVLPVGGGQLSMSRSNLARDASLIAELIVALAVCLLALPGKRADPVEEAEALAPALREARNAKRAASVAQRSARSAVPVTGSAGRRARARRPGLAIAGLAATRLTRTSKHGAGRGSGRPGRGGGPGDGPAAEWLADATASIIDGEGDGVEGFSDHGAEDQTRGDQGRGDQGRGDQAGGDLGRGEQRAPWDMAGDWESTELRGNADPWGSIVIPRANASGISRADASGQGDAAGQWDRQGRRDDWRSLAGLTGPESAGLRVTGQQPVVPWEVSSERGDSWGSGSQAPVSGAGSQESAGLRVTGQQPVVPWEVSSERGDSWGSGSQAPVSGAGSQESAGLRVTGQQPVVPWEVSSERGDSWGSGSQAPVSSTGSQQSAPWEAPSQQRDSWESDPQAPVSPTGPQSAAPWGTGPQVPASATGPHRSASWHTGPQAPPHATGPRPAAARWDSGDLGAPSGEWEQPERPDEAAHRAESGSGAWPVESDSGAWPVESGSGAWPAESSASAASRAAKPERHSHRASKHGKPSRWRGSAGRSGADGES